MESLICPKCLQQNAGSAIHCANCGGSLREAIREPAIATSNEPIYKRSTQFNSASTYAATVYAASDYGALRGIASLCTLLGWLSLGLAGLGVVGGLIWMADSFFSGVGLMLTSAFAGGFVYIILRVIAESISVLLDIEANTRRAATVLEQRLK